MHGSACIEICTCMQATAFAFGRPAPSDSCLPVSDKEKPKMHSFWCTPAVFGQFSRRPVLSTTTWPEKRLPNPSGRTDNEKLHSLAMYAHGPVPTRIRDAEGLEFRERGIRSANKGPRFMGVEEMLRKLLGNVRNFGKDVEKFTCKKRKDPFNSTSARGEMVVW